MYFTQPCSAMPDFLSASQLMEVAETIEVMEVSDDIVMAEDESGESQSIVLVNSNERESTSQSDLRVEVIDLSEADDNDCANLNTFHDTSNIIGKNFSAILNNDNITEKRLLEILNEDNIEMENISDKNEGDNGETVTEIIVTEKNDNDNKQNNCTNNNNNNNNTINNDNNNTYEDPYQIVSSKRDFNGRKKCHFDPDLAVNHLQEKCDLGDLLEAERRVLLQPVDVLCHEDEDGDTPFMIIVSKTLKENSRFYENVFAMQERLQNIRLCCNSPIEDFLEACPICGKSDQEEFFTPLSCKNSMGDSSLTCAIKMEHSEMIIDYILSGISQNKNDLQKVFDEDGIKFCQEQVRYYPSLLRFILSSNENTLTENKNDN